MPPLEEPTLGEVMRQLMSLSQQVERLVERLEKDRIDAAATYVRRDVYTAERQALESNISDVRTDVTAVNVKVDEKNGKVNDRITRLEDQQKAADEKRRQVWLTIAGLFITVVLGIAALVVNIVQG